MCSATTTKGWRRAESSPLTRAAATDRSQNDKRIELTPEQEAAAKAAATAQESLAQALERVPLSDRAPCGRQDGRSCWTSFGGEAIDALLTHTPLIDIEYLIALAEHGGIVPRHQEVPRAALITPANVWRLRQWPFIDSLAVLVLSYPWLDPWHPDALGEQLRTWLPLFKLMLGAAKQGSPHATVGVFQDFACLPQKPRTDPDETRFRASLYAIASGTPTHSPSSCSSRRRRRRTAATRTRGRTAAAAGASSRRTRASPSRMTSACGSSASGTRAWTTTASTALRRRPPRSLACSRLGAAHL
mmetsp:Transcript_23518/g.75304  ORF Transcript_23518/g.75304 Transcript_23518/m.75304 type:complete len:302 (+) Transcript_23518:98-1003(+)